MTDQAPVTVPGEMQLDPEPVELLATIEPTDIGSLFPPRVRLVIYLMAAIWSAAWAVIEANANPHWWVRALNAGIAAGVGALAASNTRVAPHG